MRKNHQQKKYVYYMKQLNGPVLKLLKLKLSGPIFGKKISWDRAKILYFVSGRVGLGPKFQFPFRAGSGSDLNFNFSFGPSPGQNFIFRFRLAHLGPKFQFPFLAGPGSDLNFQFLFRARAVIVAMRAAPWHGLKKPARADL